MTWRLFLDDERDPPRDGTTWRVARSLAEVRALVAHHGMPGHVSFDHDLGPGAPTGHDIAKAMVAADLDARLGAVPARAARGLTGPLPDSFTFVVHSQNPIGARNISALLHAYLGARRSS